MQKARVRYLDGELEGLEEWVPKQRLLVPWEEVESFLEDERRMLAAVDATGDVDPVAYEAVNLVFGAPYHIFGDEYVLTGWKAIEEDLVLIRPFETAVEVLDLDRAELLSEPFAFVDREGTYKAPFSVGERLAKSFCKHFTRRVLQEVQEDEEKLRQKILEERQPFGERRPTAHLFRDTTGRVATGPRSGAKVVRARGRSRVQ